MKIKISEIANLPSKWEISKYKVSKKMIKNIYVYLKILQKTHSI